MRKERIYGRPPSIYKKLVYSIGERLGLLNSLVRSLGYEMHRQKNAFDVQKVFLSNTQVPTIFDIGAHIGDVTAEYRRRFPSGVIYSFELLPEAFEKLSQGAISVIYSEILFVPVYEKQPPYWEICGFLYDYGYRAI